MENALAETFWLNSRDKMDKKHKNSKLINLVRYADDFIVTAKDKETAEEVKEVINEFLSERGLVLSGEKTAITSIHDGFDFLGWNFRKYREKLIIKPSLKSVLKVNKSISNTIKDNKASTQGKLILKLNQIINGWANYHQPVCSKQTFSKLNNVIWNMLWSWGKRRHPNKHGRWVKNRYWHNLGNRDWVFSDGKVRLVNASDLPIVRHISLKLDKNPFTDKTYFVNRKQMQQNRRKTAYLKTTAARL